MKKIVHQYGADLNWTDSFAKKFGGEVNGNFIHVSNKIHSGIRYFLDCGQGVIAQYVDVTYNCDVRLIQKNTITDFIGLYYNLSTDEAKISFNKVSNNIGSSAYNLSLIDSTIEYHFDIKQGSKVFVFCIFIKKEVIKSYAQDNNFSAKTIAKMMNPSKNTFIKIDRMCADSFYVLDELRKQKVGEVIFDLNMIGTAHILISNYLNKVSQNTIITQPVNESDLASILLAQQFLLKNVNNNFPGMKYIAKKFNMSESKFKILFKKITGISASAFFLDNKLIKAKELLEEKQLTITEVAKFFSFGDTAYFATKFKNKFGILPKTFTQQL